MSALVKINESIVAKLGAIIPEPFAIPQILIKSSPTIISSEATLGLVSVVIIAEATLSQYILLCSPLNLSTNSCNLSLIFSAGNSSPITPVDAKIKSLIFTVSLVPFFDLDSFIVKILDKFLAKMSIPSFPCFPVKVLAFFVLTNRPFIIFLCELLFHGINSEVILLVVVKLA